MCDPESDLMDGYEGPMLGSREWLIENCNDCAVRWNCSLETDGPDFEPCDKHKPL